METSDRSRRHWLRHAGAAAAALALPGLARAQDFPARPLKLNVGFSAGGLTDVLARLLATPMGTAIGQSVVVENKTGAAGNLATEFVAKAPADGYNLLFSSVGQIVVSPHTYTDMRVNPKNDLAHISMIGEGDLILTVSAQVPANTIQEFVALVKKNPGKLFFADSGAGGNLHLYMEYFNLLAGLQMTGVHYRGTAQLLPDLVANQVQMSLNAYPAIEGHIQQGKLRPLMVVGRQREPKLPQVPTAAEAGFKALEACTNWFGLHGPKGLPEPVRRRIQAAVQDALKTDALRAALAAQSIRPVGDGESAFSARIAVDYEAFAKVASAARIQVN
ncbi:Bug family tripartite tricarboxylate transporter substrate binding protein [Ramlibacter sp. MAHUQ-53]|uniref:Bug family tripartite tricarboxylate transporter substrate binding protein n=1 Tax=unclassified Ramlibacter TaxID=2617605 RepID=UPI00362EBC1E